uniref:Uncharacterized protein n=1 Tax=Oryza brachyantha TaxID=4533 RepID=J3M5S4_ORYBR
MPSLGELDIETLRKAKSLSRLRAESCDLTNIGVTELLECLPSNLTLRDYSYCLYAAVQVFTVPSAALGGLHASLDGNSDEVIDISEAILRINQEIDAALHEEHQIWGRMSQISLTYPRPS